MKSSCIAVARLKSTSGKIPTETVEINGKTYHINSTDIERAIDGAQEAALLFRDDIYKKISLLARVAEMVIGRY